MSNLIKKLFGTLTQKPWEKGQATIDNYHDGKSFEISNQKSAVVIIFGIATVLFSLVFTGYIYSLPPNQDTNYLLRPNLLWVNTFILFFISYYFNKISKDLEKKITLKTKKDLILVGILSYIFLKQTLAWQAANEKWKLCIYKYLFFILLFFYCSPWITSSRWFIFLGKSIFKST